MRNLSVSEPARVARGSQRRPFAGAPARHFFAGCPIGTLGRPSRSTLQKVMDVIAHKSPAIRNQGPMGPNRMPVSPEEQRPHELDREQFWIARPQALVGDEPA